MANTTIILSSSEDNYQTVKTKLDNFRKELRTQHIQHSYTEQIRYLYPDGTESLEYVWRYDFPEGIDFNF